jgi:hypothetical protein
MNDEGFGIVAGTPNHSHGRTFIPIVSRSVLTCRGGAMITVKPLGIYVVDHRTEYYYPLTEKLPDFDAVERLAGILQQERKRSAN